MKKNKNYLVLWIIGIVLLLLVLSQSNLLKKQENDFVGMKVHYYNNGVEVFPQKVSSSTSLIVTSPTNPSIKTLLKPFGVICIDLDPPSAPSSLAITSSGTNIILTWGAATDIPTCSGVDYYVISRNGNQIENTTSLTFTDINVPYEIYNYTVYAVDKVKHPGPIITKQVIFSSSGISKAIDYNRYDQISFDIQVTNTGNLPINNIQVVGATPIEFKNSLPITIQSLAIGESKILWSSNLINTTQFESTQPFWINISAEDAGKMVYEQNSIYLIRKGMEFTSMTSDKGTCILIKDNWVCDISIYAGESYYLNLTLENSGSVISQPTLIEMAISNFDGVGMTITYLNPNLNDGNETNIPYCIVGTTAYYYIPTEGGFIFPAGYSEDSVITVSTAVNLAPGEYDTTTELILASENKCCAGGCPTDWTCCSTGFCVPEGNSCP